MLDDLVYQRKGTVAVSRCKWPWVGGWGPRGESPANVSSSLRSPQVPTGAWQPLQLAFPKGNSFPRVSVRICSVHDTRPPEAGVQRGGRCTGMDALGTLMTVQRDGKDIGKLLLKDQPVTWILRFGGLLFGFFELAGGKVWLAIVCSDHLLYNSGMCACEFSFFVWIKWCIVVIKILEDAQRGWGLKFSRGHGWEW